MDSNLNLVPQPTTDENYSPQLPTNQSLTVGRQDSSQRTGPREYSRPRREPVKMVGPAGKAGQVGLTSSQDVSSPMEQDNASHVDSHVEPYSGQGLAKAMGIEFQEAVNTEHGSPDGRQNTLNSPSHQMSATGKRDEGNNLPRMQIKLPPPTLDREAADLSPLVDTNSHNIIMNRKLDSDKAQSQELQQNYVQSSDQPMSSTSAYQSLVPKNKINFDKKSVHQSQLEVHNKSPQTLRQSARQLEDQKPEKIQIGAKVVSNISELDSFAQQVATHKIIIDEPSGAPTFLGEPIVFESFASFNHCGHCEHFNFIDINEYKFECHRETCCKQHCSYDKPVPKRTELAFIDYSSSIDHTAELQATYGKYKQVINRLKNDFLLFSQRQPMRRRVADVPERKSHAPEPQTVMDVLTKSVLEQPEKRPSNTEGMPARLTGRVQKKDSARSDGGRVNGFDAFDAERRNLMQGRSPGDSLARQPPIRISVARRRASPILSQEREVVDISKSTITSERNVILLGIDGKVSKYFLNPRGSPYKVDLIPDHHNNETTDSLEQRTKESKQNLKSNSNAIGKLQQKSKFPSSKNQATKSTTRNQDILDTIEDIEKGEDRCHSSDMNSSPINQLKFSKVATQYRSNESADGNLNQDLNDRQSIKEETRQAHSPQSNSQEQLLGSLKSMNKYAAEDQSKTQHPNEASPTSYQPKETAIKAHQILTSMAPGTSLSQYRRRIDNINETDQQLLRHYDKGGVTTPRDITNSLGNTKSPNERSEHNQQSELQQAIYGVLDSQDGPSSCQRPTKESIRKSGESDRIESFQDAEKTASLSKTQEKREAEEENELTQMIHDMALKQAAKQGGTVAPKEFTLQMETVRAGFPRGDGPLVTRQYRESKTGELFKKDHGSPEYDRNRGAAAKGITNQHQKKVNMPFNHFVHPQSPPTIGSIASHVASSLRQGRLKSHLPQAEDYGDVVGIRKQRYNGQIDSSLVASEYKDATLGMNSSTLQNQSHDTYKHFQQASTTINIATSDQNVQWDASTLQDNANALPSHNLSRTNSTKQEPNSAQQVIVVPGQPIHEGQALRVASFERGLADGVNERFRNKGIATKISRALEQGALVNSIEQSDLQVQMLMHDCHRKEDSNLMSKKVQFKIDMKSRSISRSDSKPRKLDGNKLSRLSEQFAVIDAEQMSYEKRIGESASKNNREVHVALRELHAKCSNSLNGSITGSYGAIDPKSYHPGDSKQKFQEPIAMKSKTDFMKKIKIGGKNEALRQLLDHTIKYRAYRSTSSKCSGIEIPRPVNDGRAGSQMARHINAEGLEVIFQSTAQTEQFDPQLGRAGKMMQTGSAQATSPLSMSPNTINEHRKETEVDPSKLEETHRMQPINGHNGKSGAQLQLQNSMIKKAIKRESNPNMSPSETQGSPENVMVKTMTFENQDIENNFTFQTVPANEMIKGNERKQKIIVTKMDTQQSQAQPITKQSQPRLLQPLGSETDSLYVKKRRVQKKKTSNMFGGTLHLDDRHQRKNYMNLDIIDQATRASQRGSQKRMDINGSHAARRGTNRDLKNETGFEKVKFKSIDIQVQSHRSRHQRSKSPPEDFKQMSSLDREETIQELIAIESQLAALLKDPNNVSTRRYRRVPKERLLNTLRQYVFEQSFKNNQESFMSGASESGGFPHDFIEIVGSNTRIRKQQHVQKLHNNRMEFVKYIEYLGQNKKRTHNKYWQLGGGKKLKDSAEKDQDKTACLDFQEFDNLIKKVDQEQRMIQGKQIELAKLQEQVLLSHRGRSSKEATKSLTDSISQPPELKMTHSDSQTDFFQMLEKDPNMSGELLLYITQKGYLLHQPKNQMKRYANQRLLSQDHIFLNEEQIIKNNIFNENFYKIREANKIATHLDMVENKLLDKMKSIKVDEHRKRQKLVSAGQLDGDVYDASDVINIQKRPATTVAEDHTERSSATPIVYLKEDSAEHQNMVSLIRQLDQMIKDKTHEIKSTPREMIAGSQQAAKDLEVGAASQSQGQSQQPSTKMIMSSISNRSKPCNESLLKMKELEPQTNLEDIQSTVRRNTSSNHIREVEPRGEKGELDLKVDIQVKEPTPRQTTTKSKQRGSEPRQPRIAAPSAPSTSSIEPSARTSVKPAQKVVKITAATRPVSDIVSAYQEKPKKPVAMPELVSVPPRAETSSSMKTASIFNRDQLRFQSMLNFRNKQRVTRQSIKQAFNDNYLLADLKTRYVKKGEQHRLLTQNARLSTMEHNKRAGRHAFQYSTIQTGDWTVASGIQKAQTCVQSVDGSVDDENPLADLNDSVLEKSDVDAQAASLQPSLDGPSYGRNWPHLDSTLESKRVPPAGQAADGDARGPRDSIQSQKISERRLQNLDFIQARQSANLQTAQLRSPLVREDNAFPFESIATSAIQQSRGFHGTSYSMTQADDRSSWKHQPKKMINQNNRTDYQRVVWPKTKKKDSNMYLNYVDDKKPLLPALITNQIKESKRRHLIESGLTNSVDMASTNRQQLSSEHRATDATARQFSRNQKNMDKVHKSLALSNLSQRIEEEVDFGKDFKLDSARLFNHDLFLQRSKRESVTKGLQKGEDLRTKYHNRMLSTNEQKLILDRILGAQTEDGPAPKLGAKNPADLNRQFLRFEAELKSQKPWKPMPAATRLPAFQRPPASGENSRVVLKIKDKGLASDPAVLSSPRSLRRTLDEYTLNMTQEQSKQQTAQQSEAELP